MLEPLKTALMYLFILAGVPLSQIVLAYIATQIMLPNICGLVVKRHKMPNRTIREFVKSVDSYIIDEYCLIFRRRMSYIRLLIGFLLRSGWYIAYLLLAAKALMMSIWRGNFDGVFIGLLVLAANLIIVRYMAKIVLRLWHMSKTTPLEKTA